MRTVILATVLVVLAAVGPAAAKGAIESACLGSDRAGSRALCRCIQSAADQTLTRSDQRMAAKFFRHPERAEQVRMSKSDAHNAFWRRYKNFGEAASAFCSAG